jgi:hypothetical protein
VRNECPLTKTIASATTGFTISTTTSRPKIIPGSSTICRKSNNMPTETKNNTANASRIGNASAAACWLTFDCATTMPAKKAPSAIDAPNAV